MEVSSRHCKALGKRNKEEEEESGQEGCGNKTQEEEEIISE